MKAIEHKVWDIYNQLDNKDAPLSIGKKDYSLKKENGKFSLQFNNQFGFERKGYKPEFFFDFKNKLWHTEVEGTHIVSSPKVPLFELVCELRGYMLVNDLSPGDIVIDAGCSDGFITSYFGKKVGKQGKVIALEPDDNLYEVAAKNIANNKLDNNVQLLKKIFYNKETKIGFSMTADGASKIVENSDSKPVETISLKKIISDFNLQGDKIKLIKMDIEGAELDVLDDLVDFVSRNINCVAAFASYHRVNGTVSWMEAEKRYSNHPEVLFITTYPIHVTTFIINRNNKSAIKKAAIIPRIEKVYDLIALR